MNMRILRSTVLLVGQVLAVTFWLAFIGACGGIVWGSCVFTRNYVAGLGR